MQSLVDRKVYIYHDIYHDMVEIETVARKWGDSVAVIIPKEAARLEKIRPQQKVKIKVVREDDLSDLFGKFKTKKTPQQLKDESRKGWE